MSRPAGNQPQPCAEPGCKLTGQVRVVGNSSWCGMICEVLIREALTPDELDEAKARVRTRAVGRIIRERREKVLSALRAAHSVPTAGRTGGCSGSVSHG